MRILFLSPHKHMLEFLASNGDTITAMESKITAEEASKYAFIISYGYRYLIRQDVIDAVKGNIINLHISYLPWNRGADPNLWSFLDNTPKGFTIHYIDAGLDTGDIICQNQLKFIGPETLASSYAKLSALMEYEFTLLWHKIRCGNIQRECQRKDVGSYHKVVDKEPYMNLLYAGWDTPVRDIINKGAEVKCQK